MGIDTLSFAIGLWVGVTLMGFFTGMISKWLDDDMKEWENVSRETKSEGGE